MGKVLFLVAGEQQKEGIEHASSLGLEVHTLDNNPNNPGHDVADIAHYIDVYSEDKALEVALAIKPDAVVNFVSSHGLLTGIKLQEALGLRGLCRKAFNAISSKKKFREFLVENGFPSPKVYDFERLSEALNIHSIIAKPVNGGGSKGVVKIDEETSMLSFLESSPVKEEYIIEEYIDYSYRLNGDCYVVDNQIFFMVVGDYYYDSFNGLVSYATAFPSKYDRNKVECYLSKFVKKIGYGTGAMNFEFIVRGEELYCIEINPRHSGNYIHEIISEVYGLRAAELNVDILLNKKNTNELVLINKSVDIKSTKFFATVIFYSEIEGTFESLIIDEKIMPFILKMVEFKGKGDKVNRFETLYDRVALAVMKFESQSHMEELLLNFRDNYSIELR